MKKTYIIPNQKFAEIEQEGLIAESPDGIDNTTTTDVVEVKQQSFGTNRNVWDNEW